MKNTLQSKLDRANTLVTPQCLSVGNGVRKQDTLVTPQYLYAGYSVKKQRGFTLIELLVVVLVIGILAAVAVPQYTLAVNKARFSNLKAVAKTLTKASESYFLANNTWPTGFDQIDLDLFPGATVISVGGGACKTNNDIYCCVVPKANYSPAIVCGRTDYTFAFHSMWSGNQWEDYCIAKQTDKKAIQLCNAVGRSGNYGRSFFTPQGSKTGYEYYSLK